MNEQQLLEQLGRLPRERQPERDLWPGIEVRMGRDTGASRAWFPVAAAAAITGALVTLLAVSLLPSQQSLERAPTETSNTVAAVPLDEPLPPAADNRALMLASGFDLEYSGVLRDLNGQLRSLQVSAPERQIIEQNLKVLQDATEELREAIAANPDAIYLAQLLETTHRKRLDVLRGVIRQQSHADLSEPNQRRT
jgi:hypothetical protein